MSVQRVITGLKMHCWLEPEGLCLQVTTKFVESDLGGGRSLSKVDRYDRLTEAELVDVIEAVIGDGVPGSEMGVQQTLFALT